VRVVIDNATLRRHRSCRNVYTSPFWDAKEQALVFPDWEDAVKNYFLPMGAEGLFRLEWHVTHKLVPMTEDELAALKKAHGGSND
jgi:hypothetical protein